MTNTNLFEFGNEITPDVINKNIPTIYDTILYNYVIQNCKTVDNFIIANLYHLMEKTYWFCYPMNFIINDAEVQKLFRINSHGVISLSLFNQPPNENNIYQKLNANIRSEKDIVPNTKYTKKYFTCYIPHNLISYLNSYINSINSDTSGKYILNNLNILFENQVEYFKEHIVLTYDEFQQPQITGNYIYDILVNSLKHFSTELQDKLKNNYVGCLIFEDSINSNTDLISIMNNFITYLYDNFQENI
jgi:hypothetical protein